MRFLPFTFFQPIALGHLLICASLVVVMMLLYLIQHHANNSNKKETSLPEKTTSATKNSQPSAKKETGSQDNQQQSEGTQQQAVKQLCLQNNEPDITIVVGGVEFQEYSPSLRSWSNYFDRVLEETHTTCFHFPDRDPNDWEWIVSFMVPTSHHPKRIPKEKLHMALSWFVELCSPMGLEKCDQALCQSLPLPPHLEFGADANETISSIIASLLTSNQYDLVHSKVTCLHMITSTLIAPSPQGMNKANIQRILSLIQEDEDCHEVLLPALFRLLPESISPEKRTVLLDNGLLHEVLCMEIARRNSVHR
ncbi:expressed unknown protein [Seminavis robusta]|uniref:BTB domain-containing protein n=1 Tax=Seminavis robusta TaxID=568900 RepID=A0A9N8EBT2_9STRA|nr:expressed unknown protein [Seminavis robusta]|eukprot:Sro862_g212380.1 n/a (308) ;mRNA; r:6099-7022